MSAFATPVKQGTVYVVDCNAAVRDGVAALLSDLVAKLKLFPNAEALLYERLTVWGPRCLITELYLPGMNGIELMQHLQRAGTPVPTIILASDSDVPTAVRAVQAGALDFIEKPFVSHVLIRRVEQAFGLTAHHTEGA